MHATLTTAAKWFDRLNWFLTGIACLLLVLITLAICTEIVTRAAFDISNPWLVELSEITLLYMTFLGAAWVLGNDKHVALDLVLNHISEQSARYLHIVLSIVAGIACFVITWFGILTVIDQFVNDIQEPTIMAPDSYWITAIVPFGFILLGVQFMRRSVRAALGLPLAVNQN
ncbi:MAG: TRAP transporter small permease subunit [Proteobacteria bacterium]|nr:TRAP transporter small permease subunit [Pseudomonadota bacterium]